jgi:hypothetical protein
MTANERWILAFDAVTSSGYTQGGLRGLIRENHLPIDDCDTKLDRSEFLVVLVSIDVEI